MKCNSAVPNHAAIYLGNNTILHHLVDRLSSKDVYGGYWLKATVCVLRHKELG
jgi:cell wall-associated NlpC family hydrolase